MKKDDRDMLITLGTLGAVILAGGVGTAAFCVHEGGGIGETAVSFVVGSLFVTGVLYAAFTKDM